MNPCLRELGKQLAKQNGQEWTLNGRLMSLLATIVHRQVRNIWLNGHHSAITDFLVATKPHSLSKPCLTFAQKRLIEDTASTYLVALLERLYELAPSIVPPAPWVPALYFKYENPEHASAGAWASDGLFAGGALIINFTDLGWTLYAAEPLNKPRVFSSSHTLHALEVSLHNTIMMETAHALLTLLNSRRDCASVQSDTISRPLYEGIVFDTIRDANACEPTLKGSKNPINSKGKRTTKNPAWRPGLMFNSV